MDKTAFDAFFKADEPNDFLYWKSQTISARLAAAALLNSIAYQYDIKHPPKIDRTQFEMLCADELALELKREKENN